MKKGELKKGEQAFLDWLRKTARGSPALAVPIGDDAAVIRTGGRDDLVVTTDAIAQGTHFLPSDPPRLVGRKALAVCLSDIAAMGAEPTFAFVSAVLPRGFAPELPRALTRGIAALAREHSVVLAGGDTSSHRGGVVLAVTLLGRVRAGRAVTRSGARKGDVIAVTGALGGSFARGRHLRFQPRLAEARALTALGPPTAMMDVSDGLMLDLWRLTRMSGVGARVFADRVPVHRDAGRDRDRALSEGEDFELLFTIGRAAFDRLQRRWKLATPVTAIGEIVGDGFTMVENGVEGGRAPVASSTVERTVVVRAPAELEALAESLAPKLEAGDRIALFGDLGAGKTVFVRGLAKGLGHPDPREIVSPTFAIHNRYEGGRLPVDHLDLYRLTGPVRLEREGLDTVLLDRAGILCCEWAERLAAPLPGLALTVRIDFLGETSRSVLLAGEESAGRRLLGA